MLQLSIQTSIRALQFIYHCGFLVYASSIEITPPSSQYSILAFVMSCGQQAVVSTVQVVSTIYIVRRYIPAITMCYPVRQLLKGYDR